MWSGTYTTVYSYVRTYTRETYVPTIDFVLFEIPYRRASQNYQKDRLFTAPSNIVLALIREAKKVL